MRIGYSDFFYSGWFTLSHSVDKIKSSGDTPSGPMQYHIYPPLHIILDLDFMLKLQCVILLKTRCLKIQLLFGTRWVALFKWWQLWGTAPLHWFSALCWPTVGWQLADTKRTRLVLSLFAGCMLCTFPFIESFCISKLIQSKLCVCNSCWFCLLNLCNHIMIWTCAYCIMLHMLLKTELSWVFFRDFFLQLC